MSRLSQPLLTAFTLLLILSCQPVLPGSHPGFQLEMQPSAVVADCRMIQHTLGETCVPAEPKRVVALDPIYVLDPLLSLGVKPVGTAADYWRGNTYWGGLSPEQAAGIETVGHAYQPSLEKLLLVKPDLIIGLTDVEQYYPQLAAIASTVLLDSSQLLEVTFKGHLRAIAQIVGKEAEAEAEAVLDRYQQRIEALKAQLKGRLDGKTVSVIWYSDGNFWATDHRGVFFQVLKDIGITPSSIFMQEKTISPPTFSIETINQYDADILFISNDDDKPPSFFLENPLIASLEAAQAQRLYVVRGHVWRAYGPSVVNQIVDDLSKYLLDAAERSEKTG